MMEMQKKDGYTLLNRLQAADGFKRPAIPQVAELLSSVPWELLKI